MFGCIRGPFDLNFLGLRSVSSGGLCHLMPADGDIYSMIAI